MISRDELENLAAAIEAAAWPELDIEAFPRQPWGEIQGDVPVWAGEVAGLRIGWIKVESGGYDTIGGPAGKVSVGGIVSNYRRCVEVSGLEIEPDYSWPPRQLSPMAARLDGAVWARKGRAIL